MVFFGINRCFLSLGLKVCYREEMGFHLRVDVIRESPAWPRWGQASRSLYGWSGLPPRLSASPESGRDALGVYAFQHLLALPSLRVAWSSLIEVGALAACWGCCNERPKQLRHYGSPAGLEAQWESWRGACPPASGAPRHAHHLPSVLLVCVPNSLKWEDDASRAGTGPTLSDFYIQLSVKTLFPSKVTFTGPGGEDVHSSLRGHDVSQNRVWHDPLPSNTSFYENREAFSPVR